MKSGDSNELYLENFSDKEIKELEKELNNLQRK